MDRYSREELYALAKKKNIRNRSNMNKAELAVAVGVIPAAAAAAVVAHQPKARRSKASKSKAAAKIQRAFRRSRDRKKKAGRAPRLAPLVDKVISEVKRWRENYSSFEWVLQYDRPNALINVTASISDDDLDRLNDELGTGLSSRRLLKGITEGFFHPRVAGIKVADVTDYSVYRGSPDQHNLVFTITFPRHSAAKVREAFRGKRSFTCRAKVKKAKKLSHQATYRFFKRLNPDLDDETILNTSRHLTNDFNDAVEWEQKKPSDLFEDEVEEMLDETFGNEQFGRLSAYNSKTKKFDRQIHQTIRQKYGAQLWAALQQDVPGLDQVDWSPR